MGKEYTQGHHDKLSAIKQRRRERGVGPVSIPEDSLELSPGRVHSRHAGSDQATMENRVPHLQSRLGQYPEFIPANTNPHLDRERISPVRDPRIPTPPLSTSPSVPFTALGPPSEVRADGRPPRAHSSPMDRSREDRSRGEIADFMAQRKTAVPLTSRPLPPTPSTTEVKKYAAQATASGDAVNVYAPCDLFPCLSPSSPQHCRTVDFDEDFRDEERKQSDSYWPPLHMGREEVSASLTPLSNNTREVLDPPTTNKSMDKVTNGRSLRVSERGREDNPHQKYMIQLRETGTGHSVEAVHSQEAMLKQKAMAEIQSQIKCDISNQRRERSDNLDHEGAQRKQWGGHASIDAWLRQDTRQPATPNSHSAPVAEQIISKASPTASVPQPSGYPMQPMIPIDQGLPREQCDLFLLRGAWFLKCAKRSKPCEPEKRFFKADTHIRYLMWAHSDRDEHFRKMPFREVRRIECYTMQGRHGIRLHTQYQTMDIQTQLIDKYVGWALALRQVCEDAWFYEFPPTTTEVHALRQSTAQPYPPTTTIPFRPEGKGQQTPLHSFKPLDPAPHSEGYQRGIPSRHSVVSPRSASREGFRSSTALHAVSPYSI